jgi:alpha-N-acetylglucosamine transferase
MNLKNKKTDYAFCMIHFGNNKKYLEYEIYTILMLKQNTKYNIVYLYSIHDTPIEFIEIIKSLKVFVKGYNDKNITFDLKNSKFKSTYEHFNTLRTCNYIFALQLTKYKKICIIESDMIIMKNIDDIFNLHIPTILYYPDQKNIYNNILINKTKNELFESSIQGGTVNGGVLLFEPSKYLFKKSVLNLQSIIQKNCKYPNESLYIMTMPTLYNLPIKYNLSHYFIKSYIQNDTRIFHFNHTIYKPLDIIKDGYINKSEKNIKKIIQFFHHNYYKKYKDFVLDLLNNNK